MRKPLADEQIAADAIEVTFRSKSIQHHINPTYTYKNKKGIPFREIKLAGLSDVRLENKDLFLEDYTFVNGSIFGRIFKSKSSSPVYTSVNIYSDLNPYKDCLEAEGLEALENEMALKWREENELRLESLGSAKIEKDSRLFFKWFCDYHHKECHQLTICFYLNREYFNHLWEMTIASSTYDLKALFLDFSHTFEDSADDFLKGKPIQMSDLPSIAFAPNNTTVDFSLPSFLCCENDGY